MISKEVHGHEGSLRLEPSPRRFTTDLKTTINSDPTTRQLHALFNDKFRNVDVSLSTIKRSRFEFGWVSKRARYCQLIREVNKEKRKQYRVDNGDLDMDDVIFTGECTVQLECQWSPAFLEQRCT